MLIADEGLTAFQVFSVENPTVSILLGRGDGIFPAAPDFGVGLLPELITVGDLNSDGRPDLATANGLGADTVSIFLNNTPGGVVNDLVAFAQSNPPSPKRACHGVPATLRPAAAPAPPDQAHIGDRVMGPTKRTRGDDGGALAGAADNVVVMRACLA